MRAKNLTLVFATGWLWGGSVLMADEQPLGIELSFDRNPPVDDQIETIEAVLPTSFDLRAIYLLHRPGDPPSYDPIECADEFHWVNLGSRRSFQYQAGREMGGQGHALFFAALDRDGRFILSDMERLQLGRPDHILTHQASLMELPNSGAAWEALIERAQQSSDSPDLSDRQKKVHMTVLAKALVFARTSEPWYRDDVILACEQVMGTEGESALTLGRKLATFVLAADLVGLPEERDPIFRRWLRGLLTEPMADGRSLVSAHEDRPNNWGTHCGASRIAIAAYLEDDEELARAAAVFRGWLGDVEAYHDFRYGDDLSWHEDAARPLGINPRGSLRFGFDVDGVLADDQRRGGSFEWPPPRENYVYEALQGALLQALLLHRQGFDPWEWGDDALSRAFVWLHRCADYPAEGDDTWQPHVINFFYDQHWPAPTPSRPGKNIGFTDWLFGSR